MKFLILNNDTVECEACYEPVPASAPDDPDRMVMAIIEAGSGGPVMTECGLCGVTNVTHGYGGALHDSIVIEIEEDPKVFYRVLDKISDILTAIGLASHEAKRLR